MHPNGSEWVQTHQKLQKSLKNIIKSSNFFTDEKQHFQLDMKRFKSKIIINYPEVLFEPQKEHELIEWKRKGDKLI